MQWFFPPKKYNGVQCANYTLRCLSMMLDLTLIAMMNQIVMIFCLFITNNLDISFDFIMQYTFNRHAISLEYNDYNIINNLLTASAITQILVAFLGIVFFWTKFGATPSKMFLGMKIVDAKTMKNPSTIQAIKRLMSYPLNIPFGMIWPFFDKKNQMFHDKISNSIIIMRSHH